ncbi:MAG: 50S ribosomal protein L1 [Puniceicoccales bacterium]|jgi:large subunit ribosomal protein L1|nr:50S ribosomal protein L1 [Puniceicoccales bacterium]
MKKRSKRYRASGDEKELQVAHGIGAAVDRLLRMPRAKFDETVELSFHLDVDPKQGDQMVRGIVKLPHGNGKTLRVVAFTGSPEVALEAGAAHAGLNDLIARIEGGWCDFDVAVATTAAMKEVRSVAKILGPKGLMPSPKSGTVGDDIVSIIKDVLAGRCEFKMDKTANVAITVGKRSFAKEALETNINEALAALARARPAAAKGVFVKSAALSSTMSPSIALETRALFAA